MKEKIAKKLQSMLNNCKNKMFPYADLNRRNGDEITVYAPSKWVYGNKNFSILTDDNKIIHFPDLIGVSEWIINTYCKEAV